jgi:hypothetical protein
MFYYYHWVDACAGGLLAGADPGFQVRGGGALKKIEPSGGRCKIFWVFRVKNHIFRVPPYFIVLVFDFQRYFFGN